MVCGLTFLAQRIGNQIGNQIGGKIGRQIGDVERQCAAGDDGLHSYSAWTGSVQKGLSGAY